MDTSGMTIELTPEQLAAIAGKMNIIAYLESELAKHKQELASGLFLNFGVDMLRQNWTLDIQRGVLVHADAAEPGPQHTPSLHDSSADARSEPPAAS